MIILTSSNNGFHGVFSETSWNYFKERNVKMQKCERTKREGCRNIVPISGKRRVKRKIF